MAVLKGKPSIIIFYLKLRHNNLPKLQSFVFLGIDIRHLTIHNSSLSVIEESSLSSMGKHNNFYFLTHLLVLSATVICATSGQRDTLFNERKMLDHEAFRVRQFHRVKK